MLTAVVFIIVFGVLVLVHEFGHFIFAKKSGMKVEEFGFGLPPRLFGWKKNGTLYSINWIPFGGFVKILGEDGDEVGPKSFSSVPFKNRFMVIVAGVLMNLVLAALLLIIVNFFGLRVGLIEGSTLGARDLKIQVLDVVSGSPAANAGLQPLDILLGYNQDGHIHNFNSTKDVQDVINSHVDQNITLDINRGNEIIEKK
jgi:regulator of sigma E protease